MDSLTTVTGSTMSAMKVVTCWVSDMHIGIDIMAVQEINKNLTITPVPRSPNHVAGILNLRGQIITMINLGAKLGVSLKRSLRQCRSIIVVDRTEWVGLIVDAIGDVINLPANQILAPPANLSEHQRDYFSGVFKTDDDLIVLLDLDRMLQES